MSAGIPAVTRHRAQGERKVEQEVRDTHSKKSNAEHKRRELRKTAEEKLQNGNAPPSHGWLTNQDALNLLHKLASTPGSAADALKLLHELQVHQVELDLQLEQLEASERDLTEDLILCARLYDFAPVACFSVSEHNKITRVNIAGAAFCGEDREDLVGRSITEFLIPESRPDFEELATHARNGVFNESCEVRTTDGTAFHVKANQVPGESSILTVFVSMVDRVESP